MPKKGAKKKKKKERERRNQSALNCVQKMIVWPESRNPPLFSYLPLPLPPSTPRRLHSRLLATRSSPPPPPISPSRAARRRRPPSSRRIPVSIHLCVPFLISPSLPPHARTHVATVLDLDTFRFIRLIKHLNLDAGSSLFVCFLFPRAKYVCGVELNHMLHV